jgi:hypothetical protein
MKSLKTTLARLVSITALAALATGPAKAGAIINGSSNEQIIECDVEEGSGGALVYLGAEQLIGNINGTGTNPFPTNGIFIILNTVEGGEPYFDLSLEVQTAGKYDIELIYNMGTLPGGLELVDDPDGAAQQLATWDSGSGDLVDTGSNGDIDDAELSSAKTVTLSAGTHTLRLERTVANFIWIDALRVTYVPEPGPVAITSFTPVGGDYWELTLQGDAGTAYEFRSSATLEFTPGTLVGGLIQGNPGSDPGDIDLSGDFVTTDGSGAATVRLPLTGPRAFVRAQTTP